jgi:hypothetical protein
VGSGPAHDRLISGLAIYDTTTGHVERWSPGSGEPIDPNGLAWNGNDAVTFVRAGRANLTSHGYVWQLGSSRPRQIAEDLSRLIGSAGQAGLYSRDNTDRRLFYLDPATSRAIRTVTIVRTRTALGVGLTVSPSGRRIAGVHLSPRHSRLLVGRIGPDGRVRLSTLGTSLHWPTPLGWADDRHLLVVDQVFPTSSYGVGATVPVRYALARVDVRTGRVTSVASMGKMGAASVDFAGDLLGEPTKDFPAPPEPLDPRVVSGLALAIVVVGGAALVLWRRRVRA